MVAHMQAQVRHNQSKRAEYGESSSESSEEEMGPPSQRGRPLSVCLAVRAEVPAATTRGLPD